MVSTFQRFGAMGDDNPDNPNNPAWRDRAWDAASNRYKNAKEFLSEGRGPIPAKDFKAGWRRDEMKYGCQGYPEEPKEYLVSLQYALANLYYWSGNFCEDWIFFICQWHPMLGILACHPYHPWTKYERLQMFIISTSLTMLPAISIGKMVEKNFPDDAEDFKKLVTIALTVLLVTIPDTVIGIVLYQLSIANTRCPVCTSCCTVISKICMNCSLCIAGVACLFAYLALKDHPHDTLEALKPLAMGKVYSAAVWFPIWFFLPWPLGFWREWKAESVAPPEENNNNEPAAE